MRTSPGLPFRARTGAKEKRGMQIGIYGLGRMGLNMAIRLLQAGHEVVAYNRSAGPREVAASHGAK
ncbi:MAG TPA: NAD(P)-binding domain-containing protein, partial [Armatimonadota bacterium]